MTYAGAPPCSGPESAPTAEESAAPQSAPVDATTRAAKVDAFRPCSAVQIQYVSIAFDVPRIGLAAPAEEELLGGGPALRDDLVRDDAGLAVGHPRGPRDDGHHLGGDAAEVDPGLLVGDLVELAELPLAGEACRLGLEVGRPVAGQERRLVGLRLGHGRRQVVVDEEAPDVLVRELPDELLDVDPAVAERAAVPVGLGDLRLDGDDALEARLELAHPTPSRRGRSFRPDGT